MKTESIKVSYRDKATNQNVSLGTIDAPRFESVSEAVEYFESQEAGKGEETVLDYVHTQVNVKLCHLDSPPFSLESRTSGYRRRRPSMSALKPDSLNQRNVW